MRTGARHRRREYDRGAAAVEFALLLPIFVMLTFGMISAGIAFWHNIALTQGARDAARLGSTYAFGQAGEPTIDDLLTAMGNVAATESGWDGFNPTALSVDDGFVCVAYVAGDDAPGPASLRRIELGVDADPPDDLPAGDQCFDDNRTDSRVQVLIHREAEFNAVVFATMLDLNTRSSIPYERDNVT